MSSIPNLVQATIDQTNWNAELNESRAYIHVDNWHWRPARVISRSPFHELHHIFQRVKDDNVCVEGRKMDNTAYYWTLREAYTLIIITPSSSSILLTVVLLWPFQILQPWLLGGNFEDIAEDGYGRWSRRIRSSFPTIPCSKSDVGKGNEESGEKGNCEVG